MPEQVETMPGSWSKSLPWKDMADGMPWKITKEEMEVGEAKAANVRVYAHEYAKTDTDRPFKFKTKIVDGDLYLQAIPTA